MLASASHKQRKILEAVLKNDESVYKAAKALSIHPSTIYRTL